MRSSSSTLIMLVLGTILAPVLTYFIYMISAVKEEEKVMERVYQNQLDAILFSANQYSDNVINSTLDKLEKRLDENLMIVGDDKTFLDFSTISGMVMQDNVSGKKLIYVLSPDLAKVATDSLFDRVLIQDSARIRQLIHYKNAGYRKVQPAGLVEVDGRMYQIILTVLEGTSGSTITTGLLLNPRQFVEDVLSPRFQQMAAEELIISVGTPENPTLIYTTDTLQGEASLSKSMWLLPGLKVGVSPRGQSVSQIINNRTRIHLYAACLIVTLLVFGFLLILRNLRKEMRLAQAKSDFASNVSHELRTPLALISMFAETLLLERYKSPEKRKEYESIIVKESSRLTNIINKILNFSQMEANKRKYQLVPVQANAIVEELIGDYSYHLESHGFSYQIKLTEEPTDMLGDKEAIYEALVNLVDNAMKYSRDHKAISLETQVSNDYIHIAVRDHGIGIDPKQTRHIFDKFYRVTQGNIQTTRGAGLGLALVKTIAEAHNGEVSVQSEPGKGSTFTLIFKKLNP